MYGQNKFVPLMEIFNYKKRYELSEKQNAEKILGK